jgi:undecaprenyl-diphosphatase
MNGRRGIGNESWKAYIARHRDVSNKGGKHVSAIEAVLLGVIQGLTEFLPISSTAHLTVVGKILGLIDPSHPEAWTAFMAVMQLGTLAAVTVYFARDLWTMTRSVAADATKDGGLRRLTGGSRLAFHILIGTLPVALIGFTLKKVIEGSLTKSLVVIIASLVLLAALLWFAEKVARHARTLDQMRWWDAVIIGFAQAMALVPGSSRSGTTITAALFLGLARDEAARFSFLLSIPAVFASGAYEMYKVYEMSRGGVDVFQLGITNLVIATIVSAVAGYASIAWLLRYLMKNTTMVFVWYRFGLGLLLTVLLWYGLITP